MAFSSCLSLPPLPFKPVGPLRGVGVDKRLSCAHKSLNSELFGQRVAGIGTELQRNWNFLGGSRVIVRPQVATYVYCQKVSRIQASLPFYWQHIATLCSPAEPFCTKLPNFLDVFPLGLAGSQIASNAFTLGTAAVLPFYTLMVFAPKAELTKKSMQSSIPYIVLGLLYAYLLFLSWTPDTLRLMFASKYWLPELPGIAKMFSNEMTLASAWIHLLAVDLFAARQVFHDGLENRIETRHSVSLCLLFCPIGIVTHFITKAMTKSS